MLIPTMNIKKYSFKPQIQKSGTGIFLGYKPEQQVAARFLDAVLANPDEAWAFVSKIYSPGLDLDELREVLGGGSQIMVSEALYISDPKNCLTRSVYVEDPERNLRRLLHLRMIKEPDHNGPWKICGVEQEECRKI